jgi:hypothetical protein
MDFDGSRGNVRGRYEAMENIRRRDALAKRERIEAGAVRDRLEKGLPVSERSNLLGTLAALAMVDSVAQRSLDGTLGSLLRSAQGRWRKAMETASQEAAERVPDAEGAADEAFTPVLTAERVRDAGGSMTGTARTRGDYGGDGISDAMESLSVADYRHMMAQRLRGRFF